MKREQAEQIAWKHDGGESTASGRSVLTIQQVLGAIMEAVAIEREACAQVCDSVDNYANPMTAKDCANAIRARGER